ncbi:uncharacterized protein K452DRAFT_28495 [Aplosporella prunicola CBS 121167]|uniref:Autophagy protein 5 n=1 Tax=Aplosporella prunicola CBS 121167 TaxID=1176127 RepID=A0A6A6BH76_9PEZI|nr:uncharacterized protein K452DRAFT_28495 [Aplosporella prunicola CBS 121167]KAF2142227.1 hypothetical protein K452DRAFT_28495 [Aplosporella prunicola CBS 121167]
MASARDLSRVQNQVWHGSVPLEIRLAPAECRTYTESDAYLIQVPRLSYLPFLLPRLHAFFAPALIDPSIPPSAGWFSVDSVPLKWHHPLGLLYDLYAGAEPYNTLPPASPPPSSPTTSSSTQENDTSNNNDADADTSAPPHPLPWRLTLSYAPPPPSLLPLDPALKAMHDAFVNAVKEADFLRNGSAKAAMSLSKADSDALWAALQAHARAPFAAVNARLVNPPGVVLRHVPLKVYLPAAPAPATAADSSTTAGAQAQPSPSASVSAANAPRTLRVVQAPIPPRLAPPTSSSGSSNTPSSKHAPIQTLGTALNGLLPSLFPSRRSALLAQPVLHGAVVPMGAPLEELGRAAAYADGFLHIVVVMMG